MGLLRYWRAWPECSYWGCWVSISCSGRSGISPTLSRTPDVTNTIDGGSHSWRNWHTPEDVGTLELLTPSSRVVTLEGLQAGDVCTYKKGDEFRQCLGSSDEGRVKFMSGRYTLAYQDRKDKFGCALTVGDMKELGYVPVQPSPSPVERGEEWWNDEGYLSFKEITVSYPMPDIPKIVVEAVRRGEQRGIEMSLAATRATLDNSAEACEAIRALSKTVIWPAAGHIRPYGEEYSKPARAGEK